jgi:uncharacterized membrane protein
MTTVYDCAMSFIQRAQRGEKPKAHLTKEYSGSFLAILAREGFSLSRHALDQISDPELRRIVETMIYSSVAGALAGATVGGMIAGQPGVVVGAAVGTVVGFTASCIALTLTIEQRGSELVVSVE